MSLAKNTLILISIVLVVFAGMTVAEDFLGISLTSLFSQPVSFSNQSASSTAYIQNGVSGVVTLTDPFLKRTVNINVDYYPLDSGSGVVVTSDGYIITAFHVVGDPKTLKNQQQLKKMDNNDIKLYVEEAAVTSYISKSNPQLGDELLTNTTGNGPNLRMGGNSADVDGVIASLNQRNLLNVSSYKQVIKVGFPSNSVSGNLLDARLVDVGASSTDDDVALLKVEARNLPALSVSSQKPKNGENVRIYGYPGNSTGTDYKKNTLSLTTSSAAGSLTSKVPNNLGTIYYETTAQVSEGYSGGPVINGQNKVLGIVIYSIQGGTKLKHSTNSQNSVFLSSDYVIQICNKNHVPLNIV